MTYYYWGDQDNGKNHLRCYAMQNDKTYLRVDKAKKGYVFIKTMSNTHHRGIDWIEHTITKIIYHNNNGLKVSQNTKRSIYTKFLGIGHLSQIHPYDLKKDKITMSDEDIKKYSNIKYIDTEIYWYILNNNFKKALQPLTKEIIGNKWEDILENVDCMQVDNSVTEWKKDCLIPYFREGINVVPFKSNHLDNYISKLDGFANFIPEIQCGGNLLETYEKDKEFVWLWLDQWNIKLKNIVEKLRKNKIPFTYFDLDNDSYKNTFKGWDYELSRDFTHRKKWWVMGDDFEKRYSKIKSIAEEYIELRKINEPILY